MESSQPDTDELLRAAEHGDRSARQCLLARHRSRLRQMVAVHLDRRLATRIDPSDVVQETLMEAVRAWPQFRGGTEAELAAWLRQILAHVLAHAFRRYGVAQRRDVAREVSLDAALAELAPAERLCVSLCYGAGLSHSEAAAALNAPLGTVKSHVKRGLDKLRDRLAPAAGALENRANG